jgi:hypothetical protein
VTQEIGAARGCAGGVHGTQLDRRKLSITSQKSLLKKETFSSVELPTQNFTCVAGFLRLGISTIAAYTFLLLGSAMLQGEKRCSKGALKIKTKHNKEIKQMRCELRPKRISLPRGP